MTGFRFIVVADSHIRFPDDDVNTYPSNALMVKRNEFVIDLCNRIEASFVVHLGDIVHPLPVESDHQATVEFATRVYSQLKHPIHFVPGNHDIGDKPNAFVAVPPVADEYYGTFETNWGPSFGSFDIDNLHFVIIDTPVLNSGLDREELQRYWLERDLRAAAGQRIFCFTHYPPFIRDPEEDEHYDNLGEPARSWLLDLVEEYQVEAVFSGHVHNFLYNHRSGTEFYVLPSTGFVRPDYSELSAVKPESENGRDDPAKLGFFVVDVEADGHLIRTIRTDGATPATGGLPVPLETSLDADWDCPIGVTLRHGWMAEVDFPTAGLDEFRRKTVRNDATLPALWEARISRLRIPFADGASPTRLARLRHLRGRGTRFTVISAGVPDAATSRTIESSEVERWEIAASPDDFDRLIGSFPRILRTGGPLFAVGPIVPIGSANAQVHHFVSTGFSCHEDPILERWIDLDSSRLAGELVFRIPFEDDVTASVATANRLAAAAGYAAVILIELPRATESTPFKDDQAISDRVAETVAAAYECPDAAIFLDGFMDHDRSYYPRNGLIDRHHNPRPALYRLIDCAAQGLGRS